MEPIKFASYLEAQAAEIPGVRNSKRSRLKLLAALARLLEVSEFKDVKVLDITREAGLAKGTFFVQFKTKEEVAEELLKRFVDFERATVPELPLAGDLFDIICGVVKWYDSNFAMNHGVLCCLIRFSGSDTSYRQLWKERNQGMLERWASATQRFLSVEPADTDLFREVMHSAGAIMDQSLFERYGLAATSGSDLDDAVRLELQAVLIYRTITGTDPAPSRVQYMKSLVGVRET